MKFEPTPAQRAAVEMTDQSIVLSAGAGSGKTRVLVQRYVHILRERLASVEQILAITFTNKAAGEMKERIQKEVMKELHRASSVEEKEFWRGVKEELNQAQVSTFHSFCGQILRQDPLAARIDPYFHTLEELDADELLTDTIEEILLSGLDENDPELVTLVREFGLYAIEGLLKQAYTQSRGTEVEQIARDILVHLEKSGEQRDALKAELHELAESLFQTLHTEKLAAGTKTKLEELERNWPILSTEIAGIRSLNDKSRRALFRVQEILKGNVATVVREPIGQMKEIMDKELTAYLADARASELIRPLVEVLKRIDKAYREKKRMMNSLDFEDLQEMAIAVLEENAALRSLYQYRYRFVMVDEFQDTNPTQEQLIRLLIGGAVDAPICGQRLFVVGDPKQSIYRFRGADVTVFKRVRDEIKANGGEEIVMDTNFRSRGNVIEFVNHFFTEIFGTSDSPYDMEYQPSSFHRQCAEEECCVELMLLDESELKAEQKENREEEAVQIALRIQAMVQGQERLVFEPRNDQGEVGRAVGYGDICILFQALTHIEIYEEALQRWHIPYVVVNGRGFFQRQEICDIINLLKLVDNRNREIEWVGVLRSPFVGLSDEELYWLTNRGRRMSQAVNDREAWSGLSQSGQRSLERFLRIYEYARENRDRQALSALVTELLQESGYLALAMAHPQCDLVRANLEKFIGMVRIYEQDSYASLSGLIRHIDSLEEREAREGMAVIPGQNERVKLMSIHQSKGLEFPVVVVPDTQRTLINPSNFPAIVFDPDQGLGLRVRDPLNGGNLATSIHASIWQEEKRKEIAERKRHLYVAATRARDYLILSGVAAEMKPREVDEARNWLEWLGIVFNVSGMASLPVTIPYGVDGEHQILVRLRQPEMPLPEVATAVEEVDLNLWEEMYQTAGIGPIQPRGKCGYYEFSATALMTYEQCPRWYFHRYIQRIPVSIAKPLEEMKKPLGQVSWDDLFSMEGYVEADHSFEQAAERGTLIHFLFERLRTLDDLPMLVAKGIRQLGFTHLYADAAVKHLAEVVRPYMETFLRREEELRMSLQGEVVDRREVAFNLILGDALIRGSIDRVLLTPNEVMIIDYKSNQVSQADFARLGAQYQLQMELYALALHQMTGRDELHCKLHFLIPDQYMEQRLDPDRWIAVQQKVRQLTEAITAAAHLEAISQGQPGSHFPCAAVAELCPHRHVCPFHILCKDSAKENF